MGPLTGLKVVDLTHVMAGPTCTLMLADMGAEVIKIEKIPAGDDTRYMRPPKIGDEAASFLMMNRNKTGIALDLKTSGRRRGAAATDRIGRCAGREFRPRRDGTAGIRLRGHEQDTPRPYLLLAVQALDVPALTRTAAASILWPRR